MTERRIVRSLCVGMLLTLSCALIASCAPSSTSTESTSSTTSAPSQEPSSSIGTTPSATATESASATNTPPDASTTSTNAPPQFSANRAWVEMRDLAELGPRPAGSKAEARAAKYLSKRLSALGLKPKIERFKLPNGKTSQNVIAKIPGTAKSTVVLGAHYDTKSPSPGANDNASGAGVVLEVARVLAASPAKPTVEVVFFGAEEMVDSNPDHHHYGSRARAKRMRKDGQLPDDALVVDMIGVGKTLLVRSMGRGPMSLVRDVRRAAAKENIKIAYRRDPSRYGWSDHEPFELAGVPSAWIERLEDPRYHTERDTSAYVSRAPLREAGAVTLTTIRSLR